MAYYKRLLRFGFPNSRIYIRYGIAKSNISVGKACVKSVQKICIPFECGFFI